MEQDAAREKDTDENLTKLAGKLKHVAGSDDKARVLLFVVDDKVGEKERKPRKCLVFLGANTL